MLEDMECCGVKEFHGMSGTPKDVLMNISGDKYHRYDEEEFAYVVFTDLARRTLGDRLSKYITNHNLGTMYNIRTRKNPNSGNKIKMWIWSLNNSKLKTWWYKHGGKKLSKSDFW